MYSFEKNITEFLQENKVEHSFNEEKHVLFSDQLKIQFHPNLSVQNWQLEVSSSMDFIHLWEDMYSVKEQQVKSRVLSLLGMNDRIHGRETVVKKLTKDDYAKFLDDHHLMGATRAKYRFGLYHAQELVAVAGFGRECPIDHDGKTYWSSELIRFCNKSGITVVGGLTKLLDYFTRNHNVEHLMTYVDREWSSGDLFRRIGFQEIAQTPPQEFYISPADGLRYRRSELDAVNSDYADWQKVENMGNYKFIKILV